MREWSVDCCMDTVPKLLILTLTVWGVRPDSRQVMFNCEYPSRCSWQFWWYRQYSSSSILKRILITSKIKIIIFFYKKWNQMKLEEVIHRHQACSSLWNSNRRRRDSNRMWRNSFLNMSRGYVENSVWWLFGFISWYEDMCLWI
jgi:hypothetical protein